MSELRSILQNCTIERVKLNQAAGTSTITSDAVDMQNHNGVIFIAAFGDIVSGNVTVMKAPHRWWRRGPSGSHQDRPARARW